MATWSRHARALCFCAVFFAVPASIALGQDDYDPPHNSVGSLVVLQRDESTNSAYWVSANPENAGHWLFRTDFSGYLEGISAPFWLKPNTAFAVWRHNSSLEEKFRLEGIWFHGAELNLEFTYLGRCDGHWAPAPDNQKPKCRPGKQTIDEHDIVYLDDLEGSLSAKERLALYSYFYRYGSGFPATLEPLCAKCTGGFSKLLDTIARLAGEVDDLPAVPDEARRAYAAGVETLKLHHDDQHEVYEALYKFTDALKSAPWWRDIYYNRALAEEVLRMYGSAKNDLERYIATKPSAGEIRDAQVMIDKINRLAARLR